MDGLKPIFVISVMFHFGFGLLWKTRTALIGAVIGAKEYEIKNRANAGRDFLGTDEIVVNRELEPVYQKT